MIMKRFSEDDAFEAVKHAETKFGKTFHDEQKTAITALLRGKDIFVGLPTGYGKSLIFQAMPVCCDFLLRSDDNDDLADKNSTNVTAGDIEPKSIAVVISPLLSLCRDQVKALDELGIHAAFLSDCKDQNTWKEVEDGKFSVLYSSPEMILGDRGMQLLMSDVYSERLCGLFVDEAHCIVKWGFSSTKTSAFREQYSRLAELRSFVSSTVRIGVFTATATTDVYKLICESLALDNLATISCVPNRPNIRYSVMKAQSSDVSREFRWLLAKLQNNREKTPRVIVYCQRLADCAELYGFFEEGMRDREMGTEPTQRLYAMYHSQTDDSIKEHVHSTFSKENGTLRVLFSTVAFGMGVDVKGLCTVIHYGPPEGTDDYLQETGRAGRQRQESVAVLLHHPKAFVIRKPSIAMKEYVTNTKLCRRKKLLENFAGSASVSNDQLHTYTCCDVCDKEQLSWVEIAIKEDTCTATTNVTRILTYEDKDALLTSVTEYRANLIDQLPSGLLAGPDLVTGFPEAFVGKIVDAATNVMSFQQFFDKHPFCDRVQALKVYEIMENTLADCCLVETVKLIRNMDFAEEFQQTDSSDLDDTTEEINLESTDDVSD